MALTTDGKLLIAACAYVVDYGVVRDPGGGPGGPTRFVDAADAPLVQFPGTGVIFKICRQ